MKPMRDAIIKDFYGTALNDFEAQMRAWIKALRSGEYKQTTSRLQKGDSFCCLGVACDIFIPKYKQQLGLGGELKGISPSDQDAPKWLKEINTDFEKRTDIKSNNGFAEIMGLNDSLGYNFNRIADQLEKVYLDKESK